MTQLDRIAARRGTPQESGLISLAILAVGGQGGGVLTKLIVELAEANGYFAQSTYVPGVAQRTGATLYYVEIAPRRSVPPVFSLMPSEGHVDVVIAAELMEAGRAVQRGIVTSDRTLLLASNHRILTIGEKAVPGDGTVEPDEVQSALFDEAKRSIVFDMQRMASETGSHISTVMFGALAGSQALPFDRAAFERVMQANARSDADLLAFARAYDLKPGSGQKDEIPTGLSVKPSGLDAFEHRLSGLPDSVRPMAEAGLKKIVDYQDIAYGEEYLDGVEDAVERGRDGTFAEAFAKHLANAMCYMDILRVADLKTRASRFARIEQEFNKGATPTYRVTEFLHPRGEEFIATLPAGLAERIDRSERAKRMVDRILNKGRRITSNRLGGFLALYTIAGMSVWRRKLFRHRQEMRWISRWRDLAFDIVAEDPALATEVVRAQRLIKGYGDTHARGSGHYDKVIEGIGLVRGRADAADWARRFIAAALADESGAALDGALATVRGFVDVGPR